VRRERGGFETYTRGHVGGHVCGDRFFQPWVQEYKVPLRPAAVSAFYARWRRLRECACGLLLRMEKTLTLLWTSLDAMRLTWCPFKEDSEKALQALRAPFVHAGSRRGLRETFFAGKFTVHCPERQSTTHCGAGGLSDTTTTLVSLR
jgi:hypothetical protein